MAVTSKASFRKRLLLWGGIALVALLIVWGFKPRPVAVELAPVDRGPLAVTLDEEGETRVRERFAVSAPVAGRVLRIELEPGDPVVAHETVLATLEPGEPVLLDARARAEGEARVQAARAGLERARAQSQQAEAELEYTQAEVERFRRLRREGIASQEALDAAERNARSAADGVRAARFAVEAAAGDLAAARAMLMQGGSGGPAGIVTLRSPVDGEVLRRLRESEAVVPAGEPLLEVGDPALLEIVADYLSSDAVAIEPGQRALIEQWGGDRPLEARVRRVEPSGFLKISALGVEEQRVNVILDLAEPRAVWRRLGDGFRVETRVVIWEADDVLRVPASALFRHGSQGEGWAVFTVASPEGGSVTLTPVEIGHRSGLQAEVLAGLEGGETVVAHPSDAVAEGVEVIPR